MCQWIGSALVQIMACHLFCTKPISEPMLAYCQLDPWEQFSVKFLSKFRHFRSRKAVENIICKMATILSWPQCVKRLWLWTHRILCEMSPCTCQICLKGTIEFELHVTQSVDIHLCPLDKMAAIEQTIFSDAFSWMESYVFWLKFHRSLFPRVQLTITQHWFR